MAAILLAIVAGLCWGVGEILTKGALNSGQVGPMTTLLVRAAVTLPPAAGAYLLATYLWQSEPPNWMREASAGVWIRMIVGSGLMAGFAGVFFFYLGLSKPGGDISLLRPIAFGMAPATAVLLGWLVLGERMTPSKGFAVAMIIGGIIILGLERTGHGKDSPRAAKAASVSEGMATAEG
ncbi:MAG: DMT family transporter [Phycisphaeraceae bacterium]|nr:DMT family transporter [Phycisphaeraceae bacterium]